MSQGEAAASRPSKTCPGTLGLHTQGGIAGLDLWTYVDVHGQVWARNRHEAAVARSRSLTPPELAKLREQFGKTGFFGWQAVYPGSPGVCDGMSLTLYYDDGARQHSVSVATGGATPAGFDALVRTLRDLGTPAAKAKNSP